MVAVAVAVVAAAQSRLATMPAGREERGQASAEYALVLLGAAGVALLVGRWATETGRVGRLLDVVLDQLLDRAR